MGKYDPLTTSLRAQASSGREAIEMTFSEVEAVVGRLPPSSRYSRQWWANGSLTQANAWRAAGLHVAWVSLDHERVRFESGPVGGSFGGRCGRPSAMAASGPPPTTSRPTEVQSTVEIRLQVRWLHAGRVTLDSSGRPVFGAVPPVPGLYRLTFSQAPQQQRERVYVGESNNLKRRLTSNYRSPGPTQMTSVRINALLREHLAAGGVVDLVLATEVAVAPDDAGLIPLDLRHKASRLLAENAALVWSGLIEDVQVENLP